MSNVDEILLSLFNAGVHYAQTGGLRKGEGTSEAKEAILALLPEEMTMEAAHKSHSDAGAGYTIGWNSYRKELLEKLGLKTESQS